MCSLAEGLIEETAEEVTKQNSIETAMYLLEKIPQMTDEEIREATGNHLSLQEIIAMRKGKKLN